MTVLRVNAELGTVSVRLGPQWVRLRRPTVREWADWTDEHRVAIDHEDEVLTLAGHEDRLMDGLAGSLNLRIIRTLVEDHRLAAALMEDSTLWLPFANRDLTTHLLMFWQHHPVNPWARIEEQSLGKKGKKARPMRSELVGGLGALAVLYRALARIASPPEIDAMELFQVAMLLGVDDPDRDLDDDEDSESGPAGGRLVRNRAGATTRMTFTRKPGTPMRFQRRPTVAG